MACEVQWHCQVLLSRGYESLLNRITPLFYAALPTDHILQLLLLTTARARQVVPVDRFGVADVSSLGGESSIIKDTLVAIYTKCFFFTNF
jgi:hypothetical protein